jgi:hypothetical protein
LEEEARAAAAKGEQLPLAGQAEALVQEQLMHFAAVALLGGDGSGSSDDIGSGAMSDMSAASGTETEAGPAPVAMADSTELVQMTGRASASLLCGGGSSSSAGSGLGGKPEGADSEGLDSGIVSAAELAASAVGGSGDSGDAAAASSPVGCCSG